MFRNLTFFLLTYFSVGLALTALVVPRKEINRFFFRLTTLLAATLTVLSLFSLPFGPLHIDLLLQAPGIKLANFQQLTYLSFAVFVLFLVVHNCINGRYQTVMLGLAVLCGGAGIALFAIASLPSIPGIGLASILISLNALTSSVILGSVLGAMITGHWYLASHGLGLKPILNTSKLFLISVVCRTITILLGILVFWKIGDQVNTSVLVTGLGFESIIFWMRIVVGLLVPMVFAFMILSSARIASTQSATGILYATIILVLVGEVFGKFLSLATGLPL